MTHLDDLVERLDEANRYDAPTVDPADIAVARRRVEDAAHPHHGGRQMTDSTNPQAPATNQPNQAPADTTPPSDVATGDRVDATHTPEHVATGDPKDPQKGTMPGSYMGPSDPSLAGPGDEKPREGQVIEPDEGTLRQRKIAEDAERAARGGQPRDFEAVQDRDR